MKEALIRRRKQCEIFFLENVQSDCMSVVGVEDLPRRHITEFCEHYVKEGMIEQCNLMQI